MKLKRRQTVLLCLAIAAGLLLLAAATMRGCAPASLGLDRLQQAVRDALPGSNYYGWHGGEVLSFALAIAVLSLAGLWSGLREGSLPGRAAFCLGLAVVFIFVARLACAGWSEAELLGARFRCKSGPSFLVAVGLFVSVPVGLLATSGALKLFGLHLVKAGPGGFPAREPTAPARPQFSVGDLLFWTVLLASLLALVRLALELIAGLRAAPPSETSYLLWEGDVSPAPGDYARNALLVTVPVLALWHVCFSLSAVWVALGLSRLRLGLGVLVTLGLIGLLISAMPTQERALTPLSGDAMGVGLAQWAPASYYLVYEALVFGTLWMIAVSGWQLVSATRSARSVRGG